MTNLGWQITNHDEITIAWSSPRTTGSRSCECVAATPHNSRRHSLPGCSRGDHPDHRRIHYRPGTVQADGK